MVKSALARDDHSQPICNESRRIFTLNLNGNAVTYEKAIIVFLIYALDGDISPHTLTRLNRRQESDLVKAVVESHHRVFRHDTVALDQL